MCIIAAKPVGVAWPSEKTMRNCYDNNTDGSGIAWADKSGLHIRKGYFEWKGLWKDLKELEGHPVLLHCRLATHGSKNAKNCHPFLLNNGVAMAHNGIVHVDLLEKDMTDSESFGIKHIEPWPLEELRSDKVMSLLEMAIGQNNKIAMLDASGGFTLLNGSQGVMFEDVWFSNDGYKDSFGYSRFYDDTPWAPRLEHAPHDKIIEDMLLEQALAEYRSLAASLTGDMDSWVEADWKKYDRIVRTMERRHGEGIMEALEEFASTEEQT